MHKSQYTIFLTALLVLFIPASFGAKNILFLAVDDLRPELGCFDVNRAKTPSIDRLAQSGVLFESAYCQVPVCGASRSSLLSGIYPTPKRFTTYYSSVDKNAPAGTLTLPAHFRNNGYDTQCIGKIYHHADDDLAQSWSNPLFRLDWKKVNG
ncbi:MAG: sulfatase-like hydrolase/transferase, partial [Planctomycetes bacterium]|nr:sulfatase-like hydrolase/transferase [Planctomycetota bacterium]